jgi:eukaryotic-like serine/threonine-protein kinase
VPPLPPEEVQAPQSVFALVDTMLSLDPPRRFQTPSQLVDAIKSARREVEGKNTGGGGAGRTIFIVEKAENLQDKMRDRFKELGYRVMLSGDPTRALERYRQNPFDALIVDAGTVGEDGRLVFQQIMAEATHRQLRCAGILLLAQNQADWATRIKVGKNSAILPLGVKFGQVVKKLDELLAIVP